MIFETSGQPVPTEEEVQFEAQEIVQRSGWGLPLIERLKKIADPYWREAIARNLLELWRELVAEYDFGRIIRRCTAEQVEAEQAQPTVPDKDDRTENERLRLENYQLKKILHTMANQDSKHQTNIYNYGIYNDIHDNPNATIYAAPQDTAKADLMPNEGDYSALVKWLEIEKQNGNDYLADADFNRSKMCRNLLNIIGWEPNQDSLRKAQNR